MTIGSLFGTTFSVVGRNLGALLLMTVIVYAPLILYGVVFVNGLPEPDAWTDQTLADMLTYGGISAAGAFVLGMILTGAVTYAVVMDLSGTPVSMGDALTKGLKLLFPVLGVGLLTALAVFGGLILLIIPGIIVALMLFLAVPVAVVESPGVIESLKRSAALMNGQKWIVFGALFILGIINKAIEKVLEVMLLDQDDLSTIGTYFLAILAFGLLVGMFQSVLNAVCYQQVRENTEGVGLDELADVFS